MSSTKLNIAGGSTHGNVLELGESGGTVQIADGAQFKPFPIEAVAAAGTNQATGTALVAGHLNVVSGADGTKGVTLPTAVAGTVVVVYSSVATNGLPIYPAADDDINDGTTDAAITIEGKTAVMFIAADATTWVALTYTANT